MLIFPSVDEVQSRTVTSWGTVIDLSVTRNPGIHCGDRVAGLVQDILETLAFDIYLILQYKRLDLYDVHTRVPSTDARKTHGSKRNALIGSHLPLSDFVKMKLTGQFANCIGFNNAHDSLEFRGL